MSATPLLGWDTRLVRHKGTFSRYFIHLPSLSYNWLGKGCEIFHNSAIDLTGNQMCQNISPKVPPSTQENILRSNCKLSAN